MTGPQLCADDHEPIAYRADAIGCPLCLERAGRPLPARVDGPWSPLDEYSDEELLRAVIPVGGDEELRRGDGKTWLRTLHRVLGLPRKDWHALLNEARDA